MVPGGAEAYEEIKEKKKRRPLSPPEAIDLFYDANTCLVLYWLPCDRCTYTQKQHL